MESSSKLRNRSCKKLYKVLIYRRILMPKRLYTIRISMDIENILQSRDEKEKGHSALRSS